MRLEISKEGVFTPEFNGNKNLAPTDQITVRYRTPTIAIKNRCRRKPQAKALAAPDGKISGMEVVLEKDDVSTLNEMLVSISNCSYGDGGQDHKIFSAQDLLGAPIEFEPLLKEIVEEFNSILDHPGPDEKN